LAGSVEGARCNDDHFVTPPDTSLEPHIRDLTFHQRDIDAAVEQQVRDLLRIAADDAQFDIRMLQVKVHQQGRQPVSGNGRACTYRELSAVERAEGADGFGRFPFQREDAAAVFVKRPAGFTRSEGASAPVEQHVSSWDSSSLTALDAAGCVMSSASAAREKLWASTTFT
jgi:hypothetical protein